jgi:hypothetical protein
MRAAHVATALSCDGDKSGRKLNSGWCRISNPMAIDMSSLVACLPNSRAAWSCNACPTAQSRSSMHKTGLGVDLRAQLTSVNAPHGLYMRAQPIATCQRHSQVMCNWQGMRQVNTILLCGPQSTCAATRLGGLEELVVDARVRDIVHHDREQRRRELVRLKVAVEGVAREQDRERLQHVRRMRAVVVRALAPACARAPVRGARGKRLSRGFEPPWKRVIDDMHAWNIT